METLIADTECTVIFQEVILGGLPLWQLVVTVVAALLVLLVLLLILLYFRFFKPKTLPEGYNDYKNRQSGINPGSEMDAFITG